MELQSFNFNQNPISVLTAENGEPLFIAKDVTDILGYRTASDGLRILDEDEKLLRTLCVAGQNRQVNVITESGLYSLVLRSNKPEAKAFKKWVTSEVLPAIRKTGSYAPTFKIPQTLSEALRLAADQQDQIVVQQKQLKELAPKGMFFDKVLQSESAFTTTQLAKELGLSSGQKLNQILKEKGIQYRQSGQWLLHAKYSEMGLTKTRTHPHMGETGELHTSHLTVWTEKGRRFIHEILNTSNIK